ncbi:MAG TPA: hypothetical protein VLL05_21300 [Terriglobales bacterium]|nr:hypothetical protein [Terriglobales bacterium]
MKRWSTLILLFGLGVPLLSTAQTVDHNAAAKARKVTISGTVVNDGAGVITSKTRIWLISNAEVLRAYVGARITAKGLQNLSTGQIQVLAARRVTQVTAAARLGDSAFRR